MFWTGNHSIILYRYRGIRIEREFKGYYQRLKKMEDIFDFSNLDENHELFSNKKKRLVIKFKLETPKNIWIDEFICLRSEMYQFEGGNIIESKVKGISNSQSKHNKLEEYKNV